MVCTLATLLSGCAAVGPDYTAPATDTPPAWQAPISGGLTSRPLEPGTLAEWWWSLDDPTLDRLVDAAIAGNLDLRAAAARVREARARRGISAADRFPTLRAQGSAAKSRSSRQAGSGLTTELYSAGFDASWELDLFGGKRRALQAAQASLEAAQWDRRDVMVSLLAEVALNYVELRTYQARLRITRDNLQSQEEAYAIAQWRREAGLTTQLDVDQAKSSLEQTRAQLPSLRSGLQQTLNRLGVLLGRTPGSVSAELSTPGAIPIPPAHVAVGIPAEALRRRPDVRKAERQLAAQTAQVGVASAARYPSLSLAGSIGLESLDSANLFVASARTWMAGLNAAWTLFDAGRLRQTVAVQNALQEQALIAYQGSVLTALQDVENALVAYAEEQSRRQSLRHAQQAARNADELAREQYAAGLVDFQVVLDTQRTLLTLEDQLVQSDAQVTSNLIQLYKALGGGWNSLAARAAPAAGDTSGESP